MAHSTKSGGVIVLVFFLGFLSLVVSLILDEGSSDGSSSGKPYQLEFSSKFNTAVANQDDLGLSVVLAMDTSGSMGDSPRVGDSRPKYEIAAQTLGNIIAFLEDFRKKNPSLLLKIGVLKFSDGVDTLFELKEMKGGNFQVLKTIVQDPENFAPQNGTSIGLAMERGIEMLMQSGTIFRSLIVVTDGQNNNGPKPEVVLDALVNNRNSHSQKDFPVLTSSVLTSFVGFDLDSGVFSDLEPLGSRVTAAVNEIELQNALKNIFMADISKLEAGPGK